MAPDVADGDVEVGRCPMRTKDVAMMKANSEREHKVVVDEHGYVSRRVFLGALAAAVSTPRAFAQTGPPIPITAINHMTISVSDPARSLAWYQGLFGMPIAARQANTVVLRVGDGPQFMAIGGGASATPRIGHFCLSTDNFDADRIVSILADHGIAFTGNSDPMETRVRMRGAEFGGAPEGTPELYFGDPDGIVVQLQDSTYCGGAGLLGEDCLETPEPAPTAGLLTLRDYNHFTLFVTDQQRSIALYQRLFGMPIDTYQGALPVLRVGSGNQFLALAGAGGGPQGSIIHHACLTVDDFDVDRILDVLEGYGVVPREDGDGPVGPLQSYVTMRMPDRGGAPGGTPELYFTDPDGILIQLQDSRYCGGNGYFGEECGTPENPTGRNR
jgi:catechol 2,3-dioxygenase-like lactoylglutathione lyase family enzyme